MCANDGDWAKLGVENSVGVEVKVAQADELKETRDESDTIAGLVEGAAVLLMGDIEGLVVEDGSGDDVVTPEFVEDTVAHREPIKLLGETEESGV